jgi:hypothetical protein
VPRHMSFEEDTKDWAAQFEKLRATENPKSRSLLNCEPESSEHFQLIFNSNPRSYKTRRESLQLVHKEALQTLAQHRNCTSWKEEKIKFKAKSELLRKLTQLQKRSYCLTLELSRYVLHQMWTLGFHIGEWGAMEHNALKFLATNCSALKRKHPRLFNLLHLPPPTRLL